ncbi:MAG: alpha/beta hydrolase, partial [Moraxellaceae bacterium]
MQIPSKQQLNELVHQLPNLAFDTSKDSAWANNKLALEYLNAYSINFTKEFLSVYHGFGYVDAAGFRIATHYWMPEEAQGTLLVVHGYYDHIGIFDNVIRFALQHKFAVLAFDLPGHGLSSGDPAVIDSFDQYGDVLAQILQQSESLMPKPMYAFGQSTGCAVLLNYLWRYKEQHDSVTKFEKIVLGAPLILARGWRGVHMGRYVYAAMKHFVQYLHRGRTRSSHDASFNQFIMQKDCLQAKRLSLRWVGAMKEWDDLFRSFM